MIEVKGTKTTTPGAVSAYERFVLRSQDKKTATPLYFGMFLTGIALYLKSAFLAQAEPAPMPEDPPAPDEAPAPMPVEAMAQMAPASQQVAPEATERAKEGAGGRSREFVAPTSFSTVNPADFELPAFEFSLPDFVRNFGKTKLSIAAANDNPAPGGSTGSAAPAAGSDTLDIGDPGIGDLGNGDPGNGGPNDDDDTPSPNRAPRSRGPVVLYDVYGCSAALIALSDLLRNASDPDGDVLRVANVTTSSGTLTQTNDGWYFTSAGLGPVTITYQISDGKSFITQTAQFSVVKNTPISGTAGIDVLAGGNCADEIDGGGGDDTIDARNGNDVVNGAEGNDHIVAGGGDDVIWAGLGDDVVYGGAGADQIWGEQGDDRLFGGQGRDILHGGDGNDRLWGGDDDDQLFGGAGDDEVNGDAGKDLVDGGEGSDFLTGGAGADQVLGSAGDDFVLGDADQADDVYDGGDGHDTLDYSASTSGIIFNLETGTATGFEIGQDSIVSFEKIVGGSGDDLFMIGAEAALLHGGSGSDRFEFRPVSGASSAEIVHKILDFMVGDRIVASKYEIFEEVLDTLEDRFDGVYGTDGQAEPLPIRISHEGTDALKQTLIEIDADSDQTFETAIILTGHHVLLVVENA